MQYKYHPWNKLSNGLMPIIQCGDRQEESGISHPGSGNNMFMNEDFSSGVYWLQGHEHAQRIFLNLESPKIIIVQ